jgi:hypothetical protein
MNTSGTAAASVGDDLFGVATTGLDAHHGVADGPAGDAGPDGRDDTGVLHPRDLRRRVALHPTRVGVAAGALHDVGPVEGAVVHVHEHVLGSGHRGVDVLQGQHLAAAVAVEHDRSHHVAPVGGSGSAGTNTRSR